MTGSMKRRIGRVLAGVCAVALAMGAGGCSLLTPSLSSEAPVTHKQTVDDADLVQAGALTVAVDTSDAPQAMQQNGTIEGYDVDVAHALAERMGLDVRIVFGASAESTFSDGTADLYLGAEAGDNSSSVAVSGDYLENATAVFGPEDAATTLSAETLAAATVGVQSSSASQEALTRAGIGATQNTYSNVNACFEALASGEVDYVVCDATAGAYLARAYPGVGFLGTISAPTAYGLAVSTQSGDLDDAIMETFDKIAGDGTLDAIHTVWYGHLPLSLSDTVVSGVTVPSEEEEAPADDASGDGTATVSGSASVDSMNSLD